MADQPQNPQTPADSAAPSSDPPQSGLDALLATAASASDPNAIPPAAAEGEALLNAEDMNALLQSQPMPDRADMQVEDVSNAGGPSTTPTPTPAQAPKPSVRNASAAAPAVAVPVTSGNLPEFQSAMRSSRDFGGLDMLMDVNLRVKIELGRTRMLVEDVLRLGEGSVVELDKLAGDPVDIYVSDRLIAHGEILVLNDSFCVRVSEIVTLDPHRIGAA